MGKQSNAKMWAMTLVIVMVASTFVGFSALAWGPSDATPEGLAAIKPISNEKIEMAFADLDGRQYLNENVLDRGVLNVKNTGPAPLSPPPGPETEGTWTYDFDADTVDQWPSIPPWNYGSTPAGQMSTFGVDDFEDDTIGGMPDNPPWNAVDGSISEFYWETVDPGWEDGTIGSPIPNTAWMGTAGYFGTFDGSTLDYQTPAAGAPSGSIAPGQTTGSVAAEFIAASGNNYFGPAGFNSPSATSAFAGSWIRPTNAQRIDIMLVEGGSWATSIEVAFLNPGSGYQIYHWPGGAGAATGIMVSLNTWHELMIEYDEVSDTYSIWFDGTEYEAGSAFNAATDDVDGMLWFAGGSTINCQIDNWWHGQPPAGFTYNIEVMDVGGDQAVYVDQDNVAAGNGIAQFWTTMNLPVAGTGYWEYNFMTDNTAANTNGAIASLVDQEGGDVIALRANGGQFQSNNGGAWTNMQAFAASTWYDFNVTFDTVARTFSVDIGASSYGPYAFDRDSGTLVDIKYRGTGGTQSEHYIDDVFVTCNGADANITVTSDYFNSAPNGLRFQEYNAATYGYIGADQLGAGIGGVGTFSFWFLNTDNGGGQQWYMEDVNGGNTLTLISLGINLVTLEANPGVVQFVNNDGAGFWVVDGPTYNVNEWHQITIDFDCFDFGVSGTTGSYFYRWDGGAQVGPYGMMDPATFFDMLTVFGGAIDTYGDFVYDDFDLSVNSMPGAPTNCWTEPPGGGAETWNNYTVAGQFLDHGTITGGSINDIDEKPPAAPDGATEDIQEAVSAGAPTATNYDFLIGRGAPPGGDKTSEWKEVPLAGAFDPNNVDMDPGGTAWAELVDPAEYDLIQTDADANVFNIREDGQKYLRNTYWISEPEATVINLGFFFSGANERAWTTTFYAWDFTGGQWIQLDQIVNPANNAPYTLSNDISTLGLNVGDFIDDATGQVITGVHGGRGGGNRRQRTDYTNITVYAGGGPGAYSLEKRWSTEDVATGAVQLDLYVRGRFNTGSDDTFTIGVSTAEVGPYIPTGITINTDGLVTYGPVSILGYDGVFYLNVIDDNTGDVAQQDTVYIDTIWIYYYASGGSVLTTQQTTADFPVDGTVVGTHVLTNPPADAPPDGNSQQISEVAAKSVSDPSPMSPGPGPEPQAVIAGPYDMTTGFPAGWTEYDAGGSTSGNTWISPVDCSASGLPLPTQGDDLVTWINWDTPYNNKAFDTETWDLSTWQNVQITFEHFMNGAFGETLWLEYSLDGGGAGGTWVTQTSWTAPDGANWNIRGPILVPGVDLQPSVDFRFRYEGTDGNSGGIDYVLLEGDVAGNTMEHTWQIEDMPADSMTRDLNVVARYNTGSDDDFLFRYSEFSSTGPWTDLPSITVNSDTYTTYTGSIPVAFVGPLWVNVIDTNGGDATVDTLYVDAIWVDSMVSAISTDIIVHWDLSTDDGAGENDIASYDIYRADEEDGDDITGPYTFVGSSPAGATTYNDVGEGADLVNQAWYYVEANDGSQTNASGYFSKLNFGPLTSNVMADLTAPILIISPGTPSVSLTADVYDNSSRWEAIPKMNYAEYWVGADPGEGAGTPIDPVDAVWDTMIESLQGTVDTSAWVPGSYDIFVRGAEDQNGVQVYGAPAFVTVQVVDGPPIANAGPDQQVPQHTLVTFDGSLSTDDVGITTYWWNFTDGVPKSLPGVGPSYTFDNESVFTVTLTVMDTLGRTNSDIMLVNVTDGDAPVADAGPNQDVTPGTVVVFDGSGSYDPGHLGEPINDGIVNWSWTFDDGTGPQQEWNMNPTHQFDIPGSYLVTLVVTDAAPVPPAPAPFTDSDTMWVNVTEIFDIDITPAAGSNGWILVSFPNQINGDPLTIVQDTRDDGAGLVTWDVIQTYNSTLGGWITTSTFKPASLNDFTFVDNYMAFWLHILDYGDGTITLVGDLASMGELAVVPLHAGWNLIGYPFGTSQELFNTVGTLFSLDANVETYDQADPYRLMVVNIGTDWHEPGQGYWVHLAFDEALMIWSP